MAFYRFLNIYTGRNLNYTMRFCGYSKLSDGGYGLGHSYCLELTLCKKNVLRFNFRIAHKSTRMCTVERAQLNVHSSCSTFEIACKSDV